MVDKNSIFGGMLTTQGAAKKTNCDALGIPWEPRYMLIGDANGTDPVPSPSQTKLVNQVYRAQLNQLRVSPTDDNILIAELVLPPEVGGWWIRELALEDKDGVFSAVANAAPSYKPLLAQGSGRNQVVRMHIITSGTANIQLKIDPSVVLATRQYVDDSINTVLPKNKTPGEWTRVKTNDRGIVVSGDNPNTLAGMGITDSYTKAQIEAMIAQASALPVGATVAFPLDKVAPGFLELDGSVKSIAAYPDLATFLGTAFNKGDEGAGNFRLPESRGEFLRGWDHGRGVDAGRAIGSWAADSIKAHTHYIPTGSGGGQVGDPNGDIPTVVLKDTAADWVLRSSFGGDNADLTIGAVRTYNFGSATETRPRNLAVMWCIKAWNAPINQGNIDIAALAALATQATEIKLGTAKVATQAQTDTGTDDATIVTPKKMRWGFAISRAANGYILFPTWLGGLIIQWATIATAANGLATITHPIAFPTAKLKVLLTVAGTSGTYAVTWDDVLDNAGARLTETKVRATLAGAVSTANVQAIIFGY